LEEEMKTNYRITRLIIPTLFLLIVTAVLATHPTHAAVLTVTDAADNLTTNGLCSLREAIDNANNDNQAHTDCLQGSGQDVIYLPDWLFTLQINGPRVEDGNQSGDFDITDDLVIIGLGPLVSIVQGGTSSPLGSCADCIDRVFHIHDAEVSFRNMTIRYGHAPDGDSSFANGEYGGGIRNEGSLTLVNTFVTHNKAGDGYDNPTGSGGFPGNGGGIYNQGTLTAINSRITNNHAGDGGDGGDVGSAGYGQFGGYGGGIYSGGETFVSLTNTVVSENRAGDGGDGGDSYSESDGNGGDAGWAGKGGGIHCGNCMLLTRYTSFESNYSGTGGDGGDFIGPGLQGDDNSVLISFRGGHGGNGGPGGGLFIEGTTVTASLIASRVHNNRTGFGGLGGSSTMGDPGVPGVQGSGGGIFAEDFAQVNLTSSTISANEAYHGGGTGIDESATFNAMNSTFSGNKANYYGGGLYVVNDGTIELTFSTVTGNISDYDYSSSGSGGGFYALATFTTTNTIIAANFDYSLNGNPDCHGYLTSGGYNIIGVVDSVNCIETLLPTDQSGTSETPVNPLLSPLANNGGPTKTHALGPSSPAYDQIPDSVNGCSSGSTRDQRFIVRYANCDIGAYEYDLNSIHVFLPVVMR